jgi:hypothetical protein
MYGNNLKKLRTFFKKGGGQGGGCQFMVTSCFAFVCVVTNASLHLASSNPNSLDANSSMRSIEES